MIILILIHEVICFSDVGTFEMFARMLTVHCDQNDSYEITLNGFLSQKNKRNKKRNFRSPLWETFLSVKAQVGMFTKLST